MESMIDRRDAWFAALIFAAAMAMFWIIGWTLRRRSPRVKGEQPAIEFTEASMALLGLLLAFTFSLSLSRHDHRQQAAVADSNAIGDFYTCATLLQEPSRSKLRDLIRDYAGHKLDMARQPWREREQAIERCQEMQNRMTDVVSEAIAGGTPIATPLTNTLNNLTSSHASYVAANRAKLPGIIVVLLMLGSVVPAFLMGLHQGAADKPHYSGTVCFIVLVSLVIFVTLDLNQPARGFITVNQDHQRLERVARSGREVTAGRNEVRRRPQAPGNGTGRMRVRVPNTRLHFGGPSTASPQ